MAELFNVAKGKKVNALGSNTAAITDGITEAGVHWDGGAAPAQAIVDLGGFYRITAATLTTYYGDGRAYQFALYAGVRSSGMTLLYEQKTDEEATAEGYKMTFSAVVARYVKVVMLHNTANPSVHIADLAVYGEECPEYKEEAETAPKADPEDLAYGKPTRANVNDAFSFLVTDGDPESCWLGELYPRFVDVDLLDNYQLSRVVLTAPAFAGFDYSLYLSADGVNFEKAGAVTTTEKKTEAELALEGKTARVLRVLCTGTTQGANGASGLCQVKAYGKKAGGEVLPTRKIIEMTTYEEWLRERENVDLSKLKDEKGQYNIQDTYTPADTVRALEGLIGRILGQMYVDWFVFLIDRSMRKNSYELSETENGKILIHADCGVSAATALNFYLKYYCKVQVTQQTKQVRMPEKAPHIAEKVCNSSPYEVRYAYNYCTLSYTMPFFGYDKWQRELDYLMLSGVNLILDLTGMEAVWVSYLQKLGYTADQAKDYVCGYCYKAWWLMGNLEGYGGPVADAWVLDTMEMARVNQRYMTVMGAQPALETFVGAMPESFGTLANAHLKEKGFSDVRPYMAPQGLWAGGFVRPNVLKTSYDGYSYLAKLFYDTQNQVYGQVSDYYCGDVCHEGGIVPADLSKPQMSAKILNELLVADPRAVWILQGWWSNPMKEVLDGFGALKQEHILILDLAALANPKWTNTKTWEGVEFGSTPWVFCILDNYGGRTGMHGKLKKMAELMDNARRKGKVLKGIGITPEGTNGNPVVFDLFWEMAWRTSPPDMDFWLREYAQRRYGLADQASFEAWKLFEKTVYGVESYDGTTKNNVINENASLEMGYCTGGYYKIGYDRELFERGVKTFMEDYEALKHSEGGIYDTVDLLRMTLTIACDDYFEVLKRARALGDRTTFRKYSEKFLSAMKLVSELSTYNADELLGNWIGRGLDFTEDERTGHYAGFDLDMMAYNAKILLTVWASAPITNYANRQFDGLMEDYFLEMWSRLFKRVNKALKDKTEAPAKLGKECFTVGWAFTKPGKTYRRNAANPEGDGADRGLLAVYRDVKKHMGNREELQSLVQKQDAALKKKKLKEEKAALSSTIATNIEH